MTNTIQYTYNEIYKIFKKKNRELMSAIGKEIPQSIADLALILGKDQEKVFKRFLQLERLGLVKLVNGRPELVSKRINVTISLEEDVCEIFFYDIDYPTVNF